jgi:hypothetical protein
LFTFSDPLGNHAWGVLFATSNGDGSFSATSGTLYETSGLQVGTYSLEPNPNGTQVATSPLDAFYFDNQLFPTKDPLVDIDALLFGAGGTEVNLYSYGSGSQYSLQSYTAATGYSNLSYTGSFSLTSVPGPASMSVFGLAVLPALVRRRKRA